MLGPSLSVAASSESPGWRGGVNPFKLFLWNEMEYCLLALHDTDNTQMHEIHQYCNVCFTIIAFFF